MIEKEVLRKESTMRLMGIEEGHPNSSWRETRDVPQLAMECATWALNGDEILVASDPKNTLSIVEFDRRVMTVCKSMDGHGDHSAKHQSKRRGWKLTKIMVLTRETPE
mmetsp:Transcript_1510/g.2350  ORF Transcript_1510/g.2350 Transcript_1510/m.2350 type:complete len:108 (+) Transcript_1510:187-510(+)